MASDIDPLLRAINEFARNLCKSTSTARKSIILSPISIHSILTLLSQDSGFSNEDFSSLLNFNVNTSNEQYKLVLALLDSIEDRSFLLANNVFFNNKYELKELFTAQLNSFLYGLDSYNFNENNNTVQAMNEWVDNNTSNINKVKNLASSGNMNRNTNLTLLNTTYFSEKWAKPFTGTTPGTFYISENDTVEVEMMNVKSEFYYKNDVGNSRKVLQLPFVNDDISLIVILPDSIERFGDFGKFLSYDVSSLTDNMTLQEVDVMLPKFKIEDNMLQLKDYISKMGLESIFSANFADIIEGPEINLNNLQQKVFIDVKPEGLEAASGTLCHLNEEDKEKTLAKDGLVIYEMNIKTDISNRFAKTKVVWKTKNVEKFAKEATFKVVLSEMAFITELVMEIEGKSYKSYIKEKEEAKTIYNEAIARGQSAGLVEAKTRDSKEFSVSVNLEPDTVAVFNLTYEEMLQRIHDQYELVINICPGQIVDHLNVEVDVMETQPLKFVKTPPLRSGKSISSTENERYLDPSSDIKMINKKTATIKFTPNPNKQKDLAKHLETDPSGGLSGQFVVQYDVERDPQDGQVLLQDGYFVHFFAPNDLDPLPKHVVFVLDTSGSMSGIKIAQLKDAMLSILNEMRENDMINIVEFNSEVNVWDINFQHSTVVPAWYNLEDFQDPFNKLRMMNLPDPIYINKDNLIKAKNVVHKMMAFGSTYIIGGLDTALYLIKTSQDKFADKSKKHQPVIVFLTDGEPNVGVSSTDQIVNIVTTLNSKYNKVPIFSLSFGGDADKNFLRKLSLKNQGFSRHIYQAADASLQLQEFYKQISSPLLADIQFKYNSEVEEVTRTNFPIYFRGSELVVTGRCKELSFPTSINCWGPNGLITINSIIESPVTSLERMWAYLTVKQLLDKREIVENKTELTKKATSLALKYSFVTDVTSLVVVKPNNNSTLVDNVGNSNKGVTHLFGQQSSAFGTSSAMPFGAFGSGAQSTFSQQPHSITHQFASASNFTKSRSNLFGQQTATFGSSESAFGAVSFGAQSTFGQQQNSSSSQFGAIDLTKGNKFGQQQSSNFGGNNASVNTSSTFAEQTKSTEYSFGIQPAESPFGLSPQQNTSGSGATSIFGQTSSTSTSNFGQSSNPSGFNFGIQQTQQSPGDINQGTPNVFGQQPSSSGLFKTSIFGQSNNSTGFTFGIQPQNSSIFQPPTDSTNQGLSNIFGQQRSSDSVFNTPSSFGQQNNSTGFSFGGQPTQCSPQFGSNQFEYGDKSFEELRFEYLSNKKGNTFGQPPSSGLFNTSTFGQQNNSTGINFGFQPQNSNVFQSPTSNNQGTSNTFGQLQPFTSDWFNKPSWFGQSNSSGSTFGGQSLGTTSFGQNDSSWFTSGRQSPQTSSFGQINSTGFSFGGKPPQTSRFGQNNSTWFVIGGKLTECFPLPESYFDQLLPSGCKTNKNKRLDAIRIKEYENESFEELRCAHYNSYNKGLTSSGVFGQQPASGGLFNASFWTSGQNISTGLTFGNQPQSSSIQSEDPILTDKKKPEKFTADHPFIIILQFKKGKMVMLFNGCIYNPTY